MFAGLMLGTFVSSLNLTLVAPAMPAIIAQLGGLDHHGWIVLSSLLASTIVVPIAGKLSDLYGREPFYMAGIDVAGLPFLALALLATLLLREIPLRRSSQPAQAAQPARQDAA